MIKLRLTILALISILFMNILEGCARISNNISGVAMLSVSSDGRYIISTHYGRYLVLWDVKKHTKKILNKQTNIFSPYFIHETHAFLWQEANTNEVHVQSIEGKIIKSFDPGFPVYGHVMTTDLKQYIASADDWSLYHLQDGKFKRIKKNVHDYSGSAMLFQLSLEKNYLLTSGEGYVRGDHYPMNLGHTMRDINPKIPERIDSSLLDGVVVWEADTGKPFRNFIGNVVKTKATISPDANYVVGGDENGFFYLWQIKNGKRIRLGNPINPKFNCEYSQACYKELAENLRTHPKMPNDFYFNSSGSVTLTAAVKFIDEQGDFIRFEEHANYGVLYNVSTQNELAYLVLGKDPQPDIFSIFRSANLIDTAPKAKILVMGQSRETTDHSNESGIIVYRFDEKTKQLIRIWAPNGPPPHQRIRNKENPWEG